MPVFPSQAFRALPFMFLASISTTALAADLRVTTDKDEFDGACDTHCSLRDAVQAANERPGLDRIQLKGIFVLDRASPAAEHAVEDDNSSGDLDIRDDLIISGRGEQATQIRGEALNDRIFEVQPGARLILEHLTVSGGSTPTYGGALANHGEVLLKRVTLSDNSAKAVRDEDPSSGGAVANFGGLVVLSSRLIRNTAEGRERASFGGALYNQGALVVRDSLFEGNVGGNDYGGYAGALYNSGEADISRSSFIDNWTPEFGDASAILNEKAGVLKVTNSTFSRNNALAAVILNRAPTGEGTPSVELINVSIVDNIGVGVRNGGALRIRNSLIAGILDEMEGYSNGCWNFGNQYRFEASGLLLGTAPSNCPADRYIDDEETLTRLVHPLTAIDDRTYVHALRENSPALDAGVGSCTRHDQRRQPRPQDGTGDGVAACDLGAYERAAQAPVAP